MTCKTSLPKKTKQKNPTHRMVLGTGISVLFSLLLKLEEILK